MRIDRIWMSLSRKHAALDARMRRPARMNRTCHIGRLRAGISQRSVAAQIPRRKRV